MERISINPAVMVGKPRIRRSRIPVDMIVRVLGQGVDCDEISAACPHITLEDTRAVVDLAVRVRMEDSDEPHFSQLNKKTDSAAMKYAARVPIRWHGSSSKSWRSETTI